MAGLNAPRGHRLGQQHGPELHGLARRGLPLRGAQPGQPFAIGAGERRAMGADRVDAVQLCPGEQAQYLGQLGVHTLNFRAAFGAEAEIAHAPQRGDQGRVGAVDQPALGGGEGLGRMHRIDHGKGRAGAEIVALAIQCAQRGGGIDHHPHAIGLGEAAIAVEIDGGAEGGIGHQCRDPVPVALQQLLLGTGAGGPVAGVDIADERREPGPLRGEGRGGKGERRHHHHAADAAACHLHLLQRDHQADSGIGHGKAVALPAEQLPGRILFEAAHHRAAIAEGAAVLDFAQGFRHLAEAGGHWLDQRNVEHGAHLQIKPRGCCAVTVFRGVIKNLTGNFYSWLIPGLCRQDEPRANLIRNLGEIGRFPRYFVKKYAVVDLGKFPRKAITYSKYCGRCRSLRPAAGGDSPPFSRMDAPLCAGRWGKS